MGSTDVDKFLYTKSSGDCCDSGGVESSDVALVEPFTSKTTVSLSKEEEDGVGVMEESSVEAEKKLVLGRFRCANRLDGGVTVNASD